MTIRLRSNSFSRQLTESLPPQEERFLRADAAERMQRRLMEMYADWTLSTVPRFFTDSACPPRIEREEQQAPARGRQWRGRWGQLHERSGGPGLAESPLAQYQRLRLGVQMHMHPTYAPPGQHHYHFHPHGGRGLAFLAGGGVGGGQLDMATPEARARMSLMFRCAGSARSAPRWAGLACDSHALCAAT